MSIDGMEQDLLGAYRALHIGLSDMIEDGRLTEVDIPDDYQWLVEVLAALAGDGDLLDKAQEEEDG